MTQTLFGYLASRFASSPENLATEALNYILNQSPRSGQRLVKEINKTFGLAVEGPLSFSTQAGDDTGTIPDMVGIDSNGQESLFFEMKFWAGLTDNQPINYLKRLPEEASGGLIFVCPDIRIGTLWPELVRRLKVADIKFEIMDERDLTTPFVTVGKNQILGVISWREILNILQAELEKEGDQDRISDLEQLRGLCDRMNQDAFLPLQPEELAGNHGRRILQLKSLVDQAVNRLAAEEKISLKDLRTTHIREGYRRYFRINTHGGCLELNFENWCRFQETPIWIMILKIPNSGPWIYSPEVHEALRSLEVERPPRLYKKGDELLVPVYLPTNEEEQQVVQAIYDQFVEIIDLLPDSGSNG